MSQPPALLNQTDVAVRVGVTPLTLSRWVARGDFPAPDVAAGCNVRRWNPETVAAYVVEGPSLNLTGVALRLGMAKSTFRALLATGGFPPPDVRIGTQFMLWRTSTVEAWKARVGRK